jgi:hypothetical protein
MAHLTGRILTALALGGALIAAVPAQADRGDWHHGDRGGWHGDRGWHGGWGDRGYRRYDHDDAGLAIGVGILGLAIGAAAASDRDRGYYYAPPPPPPPYGYYRPYYDDPYGY